MKNGKRLIRTEIKMRINRFDNRQKNNGAQVLELIISNRNKLKNGIKDFDKHYLGFFEGQRT